MKQHFYTKALIIAAVLAATVPACSLKEDLPWRTDGMEGIVLLFSPNDAIAVKATVDSAGVASLNENKLVSIEYFLYPTGKTNQDALIHGFINNPVALTPYQISIDDDSVGELCPGSSKYFVVYAIANYNRIIPAPQGNDSEDLSGTSVPELEALTRNLDEQGGSVKLVQDHFLMSSGAVQVGPIKRAQKRIVEAIIPLQRVASKLSILVRVAESYSITNTVVINNVPDVRNEVWVPRINEMTVYLVNGSKTGKIGGAPIAITEENSDEYLFSYGEQGFNMNSGETHTYQTFTYTPTLDNQGNPVLDSEGRPEYDYVPTTETGTFYPCVTSFYSYPEQWEYGTVEEPYLKLMIPWDRRAGVSTGGNAYGATSKQYYYRVYCPGSTIDANHSEFLRNHWYKVILNVGILGSEVDGGESIINGQYFVADWQERDTGTVSGEDDPTGVNDSDKETEIKGARYLFMNKTKFDLYNINEHTAPYTTSNTCEIVNFHAVRYNFSGTTKQEESTDDPADWNIELTLTSTQTGAHIHFYHALNNDINDDDYDVSPYTITFRIRQTDAIDTYYKDITIHQYPAIQIDPQMNTDGTNDKNHGYVLIDTYNSTSTDAWRRNTTLSGGNNANPNMYIISASVLSDASMLIGDPRTTEYYSDSQLVSNWTSTAATHIDGSTNVRLRYYYKTNQSEEFKNIIAPSFRVASSYGKSQSMSYDNALRRCAAYQEDGYPAGRWRLPTMAEVLFITTLSQDGMIPELFTFTRSSALDESYWCASGKIDGVYGVPTYFSGTTGNRFLRCVYDEWYWNGYKLDNDTDISRVSPVTTFKWGDVQR